MKLKINPRVGYILTIKVSFFYIDLKNVLTARELINQESKFGLKRMYGCTNHD